MTGMPCDLALVSTWAPAPFRSTSSITPQPLLSCWSAIVAYFSVSFWAFWMSAVKPAAVSALFRAGRSPLSQRGDDSVSGRMTQARLATAFVAPPELLVLPGPAAEHPARARVERAATATIPMIVLFKASLPFIRRGLSRRILDVEELADCTQPWAQLM